VPEARRWAAPYAWLEIHLEAEMNQFASLSVKT
jgi:hypothetical protein